MERGVRRRALMHSIRSRLAELLSLAESKERADTSKYPSDGGPRKRASLSGLGLLERTSSPPPSLRHPSSTSSPSPRKPPLQAR